MSKSPSADIFLSSTEMSVAGVTAEGLRHGAYRIVSGEDWMVFIGDDTDFVPIEPWPKSSQDNRSGKIQREWNAITGKSWGYPNRQIHKHYTGPHHVFGTPNEQKTDADGNVHVWIYDERGSFNTVCDYLRRLGMRWYMPGKIGEIVPALPSIPLTKINETVRPDFPMRIFQFRPLGNDLETMKNHPEWFALYGGKRHNNPEIKKNQLCYSNEELFREVVRFAQVQFDHYKMDVVSIMPPDGYTAICQCQLCEGKESPELGPRGKLSNYVWDFVNRIAKEIANAHPGGSPMECSGPSINLSQRELAGVSQRNRRRCSIVGGSCFPVAARSMAPMTTSSRSTRIPDTTVC